MKFTNLFYEPYKDIFNYCKEIQKINQGFRLFYNKKTKQICIINIFNNYEICNSFKSILEINLRNLRFLLNINSNKIFKFIEESNALNEEKIITYKREVLNYQIKELYKLSNRSAEIKNNEINKIIGANKC